MWRAQGNQEEALHHYRAALELAWLHGDMRAIARTLGRVAGAFAGRGNVAAAARLFGASEALHERMGFPFAAETLDWQRALGLPEPWRRADEGFGAAQAVHDALARCQFEPLPPIRDPGHATRQWEAGRSLSVDAAITEALRVQPHAEPLHGLSSRELEVLRLLTTGKTDVEIAETLYITRHTASAHVEHIYTKLNVSSRAEAAAWRFATTWPDAFPPQPASFHPARRITRTHPAPSRRFPCPHGSVRYRTRLPELRERPGARFVVH